MLRKEILSLFVQRIWRHPQYEYFVAFVVLVSFCGVFYWVLTPYSWGIGQNLKPLPNATFWDGLYFSVVTVTSLGYGDLHPMGVSKTIAGAEVVTGLILIGIMIAKATSRRLSSLVSHLFRSDAQERLEQLTVKFGIVCTSLKIITREIETVYQQTPNKAQNGNANSVLIDFEEALRRLLSNCLYLHDYFMDKAAPEDHINDAPTNAVVRIGAAVNQVFLDLYQLVVDVPPQARTELLDQQNSQKIAAAIESQRIVCAFVRQYATDPNISEVFQNIERSCSMVADRFVSIPKESQPDQVLQGTDEPGQSLETDDEMTSSL